MSKGEGFYNPSFSSITEAVVRTVRMVGCLLLTTAVNGNENGIWCSYNDHSADEEATL